MNEIQQNKEKFASIEHLFEERLGIRFPESPDDLPAELVITEEIFGGLIDALLSQEIEDKSSTDRKPKERSQFVGYLNHGGHIQNSPVFIGSEMKTGDGLEELKRWFRPLFGNSAKPLVYWHTHTMKADSPFPTESDIAQRFGEDRKCLIYLHASPTEITAIIQTKKSIPQRIPFSTVAKGMSFYDELKKFYDSSSQKPRISDLALFLEKKGYALYMWKKPKHVHSVKEGIETGEFTSGIKLNKIGLPKYIRVLIGKK